MSTCSEIKIFQFSYALFTSEVHANGSAVRLSLNGRDISQI